MATNRDKILKEAEKLVQKGKIDQAIREYEKLLQANPNDANTINRVGDLYGRVGQVDKAIELYERIADHFTQDGFTTKAIAIYKKINRLAPQRLDIFERLADLYMQQGLVVEAKSQYQMLAEWYARNGNLEKAISTNRTLVQLDPDNHIAHLRLADLLIQHGDPEEAVGVYQRLGELLLGRGKLDEAERLYRHALEQNPPTGSFLAPVCEALLEAGRTTVAREFLTAATKRSPEDPRLRVLEVRTRLVLGDATQALDLAREILEAEPDNIEFRQLVGKVLLSAGEAIEARDVVLPAADALIKSGDYAGAQKLLDELLKVMPKDQEVLRLGLKAFEPSGDEEMVFTLKAALADSEFRGSRKEVALRLYRDLLDVEPGNALFRQRVALLEGVEEAAVEPPPARESASAPSASAPVSDEDQTHGSLEPVEPALTGTPSAERPPFDPQERLAEATVFAKYGLVDKAVHHLEEILGFFPDDHQARHRLALLHAEQGRTEDARQVAGPLVEHYRSENDREALDEIVRAIPGLPAGPAAAEAEPEPLSEDDEVIILDVEGEVAEEIPIEVVETDLAEPIVAAEEPVEIGEPPLELDEEPLEVEPDFSGMQDGDAVSWEEPASAAGPELRQEAGQTLSDLDALEQSVLRREQEQPVQQPPPAQEEAEEELVELTDAFAGPPLQELKQLDFFIEQELHEDALRLLEHLEAEYPGDGDVAQRRLALKSKGVLLEDVVQTGEGPEELFADEEEYIDLARELESELAEEEAMVEEATGRGREEAELEEVFREFQKGVSEQLSEEDSDTHFNLGIAYKEMGLLPEAIREFQISSRDRAYFVESCSMIGVCYLEQGMADQAAEWYRRALEYDQLTDESRLALRYDLATALEMSGDVDQAIEHFETVAAASPGYRDTTQRLNQLGTQRRAN